MKKLQKLRLRVLNEQNLAEKQMNSLRGGLRTCYCSCYWANQGGFSYSSNSSANYSIGSGGYSTEGCNQYAYQEGENGYGWCPNCNENINGYGTY
jgi:natural product precursor